MPTILFVVHSSSVSGGAPLSLAYLIRALSAHRRWRSVVACIHDDPDLLGLFRSVGADAFYWPGISIFPHTTGGWYRLYNPVDLLSAARAVVAFGKSEASTRRLLKRVQPDIVHLNSVTVPASAVAAKRAGFPVLWHVRESVRPGHFGIRRRWLSSVMTRHADEAVFLSEDDRRQLNVGNMGVVMAEAVDFTQFDRSIDGAHVRRELNIESGQPIILFVGGRSRLKGAHVLLRAAVKVLHRVPSAKFVFAGALGPRLNSRLARVVRATCAALKHPCESDEFFSLLDAPGLREAITLLPFRSDPPQLMAACDLLVFPSTQPHFARPAVEAAAMGKPAVVSRLGGLDEIVVHNETGLLVPSGDPAALAEAICTILESPTLAAKMGAAAYWRARRLWDLGPQIQELEAIYERLLTLRSHDRQCAGILK